MEGLGLGGLSGLRCLYSWPFRLSAESASLSRRARFRICISTLRGGGQAEGYPRQLGEPRGALGASDVAWWLFLSFSLPGPRSSFEKI